MSESAEVKKMGTRSKAAESTSSASRISPRRRNVVIGAGAVRSSNVEKAKDGSLIYKRRSSTGTNSTQNIAEAEQSSKEKAESAPAESRIHKRMRTIHTNSAGEEVESDAFCWLCHREGDGVCCELCPRMYHLKCLNVESVASDWVCPECEKILQAECVDTRSRAMSLITVDQLCVLLKYALQRMKHTDSADFHKPVDLNEVPHYTDYIHNPMDLTTLEKNIRKKLYGSTEAFLADAKYILHNCIVFNGERNKLTSNAKMVLKICKHEMNEIEICPDCYMNSCTKQQENWFCEPCRYPHTLVWAKMKGYPYWPAKALRVVNGQVDVRFFGEHDRAWVPVGQVYLLSKDPPVSIKKGRGGYDQSMEELSLHIQRLKNKFGSFEYAPNKMVYDPYAHIKAEDGGQTTPAKLNTSSSSSMPTLSKSRSPGSNSGLRSASAKSPDKSPSIVTRTASAVKLKYSSIISTRHTKLKGQTIGDNVIVAKDDNDGEEGGSSSGKKSPNRDPDSEEPTAKKPKLEDPETANKSSQPAEGKQQYLSEDRKNEREGKSDCLQKKQPEELCSRHGDVGEHDDKMEEDVSEADKGKASGGDEKLSKVFLLDEDAIKETKPNQNLCSLLDVVPKIKRPDKKVISEIENKIKHLQEDDNNGDGDGDRNNGDDGVDDEDGDKGIVDSKAKEAGSEGDKVDNVKESEGVKPSCTESEQIEAESAEKSATTGTQASHSRKKNAFLEQVVASCKEKLGVDNNETGDISLRLSVSEADDDSSIWDQSNSESLSDNETTKLADSKDEERKTQTHKANSPVADSSVPMEGVESTSATQSEVEGQEKSQATRDDNPKKGFGDSKSTLVPMETNPSETIASHHKQSNSDASETGVDSNEVCEKTDGQDVIVVAGPDSGDGAAGKKTPERRPDGSSTRRSVDMRCNTDDRTGRVKMAEARIGQKSAAGAVKIKPQNVHVQKPQMATVLPEKITPQAQKSVISMMNGNSMHSPSLSKQQENIPSDFSPVTPEIDFTGLDLSRYTDKVMKTVQSTLQEFCMDMIQTDVGSVFRQHLQLEVKRLEWHHQQELNEIKHTANLKLLELRATMELEKEKAIDSVVRDLKYKFEAEKKQAIEETKKKQWCANCGKEAIFYCCWNTSYCDYPCQQAHWPQHMSSCTQSQNSQQSHDSRTNQSDTASNSVPGNLDKWQTSETSTNRIMTQTASVIHNQPHNVQYIRPAQRLPVTQVGGSVLRYIQPNPGNPSQRFQHNNPQQFQLSAMNQMNQSQPPLIMVSTGPTHQGQLRPVISHAARSAQSLLLPQAGHLPPNMMQGSGMRYRPDF